jgi:hypothetical protein
VLRRQLWLKLAALALVLASLGLPLNDLPRFALLVIATVLVITGEVSSSAPRWIAAAAVAALAIAGQLLLAAPRIEEGHNVFIVDGERGKALAAGLPAEVFAIMRADFDGRYPPERRCDPNAFGCWRGQAFPETTFAFSADGIYDRAPYSRRVTDIDFADPVWLRLGFINEVGYNWISPPSDIERAVRDRRSLALFHRYTVTMPWFVMYRFSAAFVGSELCWRGKVLWERGERLEAITHFQMTCRGLTLADVDKPIFGLAIGDAPPLAMRLVPTLTLRVRQLLEPAFALIGGIAALAWLVRSRWRRTILPFALIVVTLTLMFLDDVSFLGGVRPFDAGDDGLVYDGLARVMLRHLVAGDIWSALEGGEPVFYFTPGMRYLRVVEHLIFGETYLGYVALILLLPFLVFALFRRFLPLTWALAMVTIFAAVPIGVLFGSSLVQYVKWAAKGFADPAAFTLFIGGLVLLLRNAGGLRSVCSLPPCGGGVGRGVAVVARDVRTTTTPTPSPSPQGGGEHTERNPRAFLNPFGAGFLLALALFLRPNLAPLAGVLLTGAALMALWRRHVARVIALCVGFAPVLGMALHNWVYGSELVLFTSTVGLTMLMPPSTYLAALSELLRGDFAGEHVARAIEQIGAWLAGPSGLVMLAPLHAIALVVLVRVVLWRAPDPWLRLIAFAVLVQHGVALFFAISARYHYVSWLLTLLVVAAWVNGEALAMLHKRWPHFCDRVAAHPARLAVARGLDRMVRMA